MAVVDDNTIAHNNMKRKDPIQRHLFSEHVREMHCDKDDGFQNEFRVRNRCTTHTRATLVRVQCVHLIHVILIYFRISLKNHLSVIRLQKEMYQRTDTSTFTHVSTFISILSTVCYEQCMSIALGLQ